jgi:hypothetical protein
MRPQIHPTTTWQSLDIIDHQEHYRILLLKADLLHLLSAGNSR